MQVASFDSCWNCRWLELPLARTPREEPISTASLAALALFGRCLGHGPGLAGAHAHLLDALASSGRAACLDLKVCHGLFVGVTSADVSQGGCEPGGSCGAELGAPQKIEGKNTGPGAASQGVGVEWTREVSGRYSPGHLGQRGHDRCHAVQAAWHRQYRPGHAAPPGVPQARP
ncbi:MAG: hypothetical protein ACI8QS_003299 [Planctomycetota bacterium]|jgi:hypothetical protein